MEGTQRGTPPHHSLHARGLIAQVGGGTLEEIFSVPRKVYLGIDPSADSIHVGNLVPVILLKHLCDLGHTPVLLVGGGTGLIGDPKESGERPLLAKEAVRENAAALARQLSALLQTDSLLMVDNAAWLTELHLIDFLRDIGKHFSVNQLIKRDVVRRRLETEEDSISYTEFSYTLLQAYDFLHLFETQGVTLQVGGADQWGNIVAGVDLIRRKKRAAAYALTTPLVVDKTTGKKFGKSEGNAVWLAPDKTSPFAFYQFWLNVADENVEEYLKIFTFMPLPRIAEVVAAHRATPHARHAQRTLAHAVTAFVHGAKAAEAAEEVSRALFGGGDFSSLSEAARAALLNEVPSLVLSSEERKEGVAVADALVRTGLATSKSEARRLVESGGVTVDGVPATSETKVGTALPEGRWVLLRRGKKVALVR